MTTPREPLPLLPSDQTDRPLFLIGAGATARVITSGTFLARALALSRTLPEAPYLINLCNDRYRFALSFAAALMRGTVSLFPPNRLVETAHEIARDYPGAICLGDAPLDGLRLPLMRVEEPLGALSANPPMPLIAAEREAFIIFTSGSTGRPQPHPKVWGDLVGCARVAGRRFGFRPDSGIVATVVPQHMYGLELSIMVPFVIGAQVVAARPFFPADIRAALADLPAPRILVTTPVHLAACVESGLTWPALEMVISATAPLPGSLAEQVETRLSTRVREIYGSTETGSIASRETCRDPVWRWYDSVRPSRDGARVSVTADFLPGPVPLADVLEFEADGGFRLVGRASEMIKVAGKRASLADLNRKLNAIDGVRDGVFVALEAGRDQIGRLAVVVVAPCLDRGAIIAGLAGHLDPVFYPRQIVFVDALPRNETGKLPRQDLLRLLRTQTNDADDPN
ncbi:acyl-CoA synthetase/AMP-acid ligase [Thiocystis violascens DSM 198]|uniref:Acyl-CoA synthetase/AMP-acid ligase n=1 Tax=Thiocystis violascens (strain ATCC 17096 / DSM 198 / 6111) TaxID=765911 RepID=I3YB30_THIV6|nr:acyl-CoA synthetase/AMP-acid ligase [Thiocystis violascens DSM 198]